MEPDKKYGLLRLRIAAIMHPFDCYGLSGYIPEAIEAIVDAARRLDNDQPLALLHLRQRETD